jgi:hypothetical protein
MLHLDSCAEDLWPDTPQLACKQYRPIMQHPRIRIRVQDKRASHSIAHQWLHLFFGSHGRPSKRRSRNSNVFIFILHQLEQHTPQPYNHGDPRRCVQVGRRRIRNIEQFECTRQRIDACLQHKAMSFMRASATTSVAENITCDSLRVCSKFVMHRLLGLSAAPMGAYEKRCWLVLHTIVPQRTAQHQVCNTPCLLAQLPSP